MPVAPRRSACARTRRCRWSPTTRARLGRASFRMEIGSTGSQAWLARGASRLRPVSAASAKATCRWRSFVLGHKGQIRIPNPHPPPKAPGPTGRFEPLGWPRGRLASLVHGICPPNTQPWEIDAQPWEIDAQPWEIDPKLRSPDPKHRSPTADTPNVPTHNPRR